MEIRRRRFLGRREGVLFPCGYLVKNEHKVVGAFLAGCNEEYSGSGRDLFKAPKAAYKAGYAVTVAASMKKNGISNIRAEVHQGKNSMDYGQLAEALKWFAEP